MTTIVNNVVARLLSMLDPTGVMAVVNGFIAFFNAIQSAIEYLRDILEIINRYVTTLAADRGGQHRARAPQMLEQGLAAAIPIAIGFLANQVGIGNVPEKIVEIIGGLRDAHRPRPRLAHRAGDPARPGRAQRAAGGARRGSRGRAAPAGGAARDRGADPSTPRRRAHRPTSRPSPGAASPTRRSPRDAPRRHRQGLTRDCTTSVVIALSHRGGARSDRAAGRGARPDGRCRPSQPPASIAALRVGRCPRAPGRRPVRRSDAATHARCACTLNGSSPSSDASRRIYRGDRHRRAEKVRAMRCRTAPVDDRHGDRRRSGSAEPTVSSTSRARPRRAGPACIAGRPRRDEPGGSPSRPMSRTTTSRTQRQALDDRLRATVTDGRARPVPCDPARRRWRDDLATRPATDDMRHRWRSATRARVSAGSTRSSRDAIASRRSSAAERESARGGAAVLGQLPARGRARRRPR